MTTIHESETWTMQVADGWSGQEDEGTAIFEADPAIGVLEVNAFVKDGEVTHEDLEEFAAEHIEAGATPEIIEHPEFDGFGIAYEVDGEFCTEWYFRGGPSMLFVTYTCPADDRETESEAITEMLETLALTEVGRTGEGIEDPGEESDDDESGPGAGPADAKDV